MRAGLRGLPLALATVAFGFFLADFVALILFGTSISALLFHAVICHAYPYVCSPPTPPPDPTGCPATATASASSAASACKTKFTLIAPRFGGHVVLSICSSSVGNWQQLCAATPLSLTLSISHTLSPSLSLLLFLLCMPFVDFRFVY